MSAMVYKTHKQKKNKGFTLVELLLAIGILAGLTAVTVPGFATYSKNQRRKQALTQIMGDISLARNNATSSKSSNSGALYWGIRFKSNSNTYNLQTAVNPNNCGAIEEPGCSEGVPGCFANTHIQNKYNLPEGMITRTNGCVYFKISDGAVAPLPHGVTSGTTRGRIVVGFATDTGTECVGISISNAGVVSEIPVKCDGTNE